MRRGWRRAWPRGVGGALEEQAAGTELGVGGELVLNVGDGPGFAVAAEQLDRAETVLAAEVGVFVHQGDGDVLDLPVGLVSSAGLETATANLALVLFPVRLPLSDFSSPAAWYVSNCRRCLQTARQFSCNASWEKRCCANRFRRPSCRLALWLAFRHRRGPTARSCRRCRCLRRGRDRCPPLRRI